MQKKKTNLGIAFVMKSLVVASNKQKCTLCLFCEKLFEKKLINNMEARGFLLRNRENEQKLREFVGLIWPSFQKMAILNKRS